jgi:hypothetical protein
MVRSRLTVFPTSWQVVGRWLREPSGRPGLGRLGLGALAGRAVVGRMFGEAASDSRRGQPGRRGWSFPGAAEVFCEGSGQA